MGFGLPASLGVKYAFPEEQVVNIAGDGSLQMNFHELATAMNEDLPVMICLLNNGWLGMVKQWQKLLNDKRYSGTDMGLNPDFVALAKAYGADGIRVERPSELAEAFRRGLSSDVPITIDIHTDPEEDVLPDAARRDGLPRCHQGQVQLGQGMLRPADDTDRCSESVPIMTQNFRLDGGEGGVPGPSLFSFQEMLYMFSPIMINCVRHHVRDWRLDFACKRSDDCHLNEASFFKGMASMIAGL